MSKTNPNMMFYNTHVLYHGHSKMLHSNILPSTMFPMGKHSHEEKEEIRSDYHKETFLS